MNCPVAISTPKNTILSEADKDFIRTYVSEWINDEEKKRRRKECAERFWVTIPVIGAITAWTKIWWDRTGKTRDIIEIVPEKVLTTIEKVRTSSRNQPWEEDFLIEFAHEFNLRDPIQLGIFYTDVLDIFPGITREDISSFIDKNHLLDIPKLNSNEQTTESETSILSGEWAGALINYDNELKQRWRAKLAEFIVKNSTPEERANMKVLCLPGVECYEIPMYLELWFRPENIIGVEAGIVNGKTDPKLLARFEQNAARYGIQYRLWKLERILKNEQTLFDVVSLDFLWPFGQGYMNLFEYIHLNSKAIILTNFQWRRENDGQHMLRMLEGKHNGDGMYISTWKNLKEEIIPFVPDWESSAPDISLEQARNAPGISNAIADATLWSVQPQEDGYIRKAWENIFSTERIIKIQKRAWEVEDPVKLWEKWRWIGYRSRFDDALRFHLLEAATGLVESVMKPYVSPEVLEWICNWFMVLFRTIILYSTDVRTHTMYSYVSETGTPMVTDCMVIGAFNEKKMSDFKHTNRFVLTFLDMMVLWNAWENDWFDLSYCNKNLQQPTRTEKDDVLVLKIKWKIVASIPYKKFFQDLSDFAEYYSTKNRYSAKRILIV